MEFALTDGDTTYRWSTVVCFFAAPIPYRILGFGGCLEFFDVTFRGADQIVEFEPNLSYPGAITSR